MITMTASDLQSIKKVRQRMPFVRRGSEGYEVRLIDHEKLLAEYITNCAHEDEHYCRYVPEPPRERERGREGEEFGAEVKTERVERDDYDDK
jgi:hypothetical protein